jgi:hypothetical protein
MTAPAATDLDVAHDALSLCAEVRLDGMARHVSTEGCQLVISGKPPGAGRRLSFTIEPARTIAGTIQWVLGNRVGFVFDCRIDAAVAADMAAHMAKFRTLELLLIDRPLARE